MSNKDNKFQKYICWKTDVWNEYTKTKGLHHVSYHLSCKRQIENSPGSFKNKFHPSKLPLNHTKSSSTYQLKVNNFKTERYSGKPVVNKYTIGTISKKKL